MYCITDLVSLFEIVVRYTASRDRMFFLVWVLLAPLVHNLLFLIIYIRVAR